MTSDHAILRVQAHQLARLALFGFILTFVIARACVLLIMSRQIPNLYFFLQGTHVHHLNYGIFLLAAVGGYSVFRRPVGRTAEIVALVYGLAMALTFDEFGMWLHLGGSYWQRASVDAVIVIGALFGLFAYARSIAHSKHITSGPPSSCWRRWAASAGPYSPPAIAWAIWSARSFRSWSCPLRPEGTRAG